MTEPELSRVIAVGALRLRLNAASRWFCGALLVVSAVAATGVLMARLRPEWGPVLLALSWLLPGLVAFLGACGFRRCRPAGREVALRLDRAAGLQEHLTTWEENRGRPLPEDPVSGSFIALQRASTLRVAEGVRPWGLLPLVLPRWTRGLWLALMALGCALLMPEQRGGHQDRVSGARADEDVGVDGGVGGLRRLSASEAKDTFRRVEILSPAEQLKYSALAFGPDVPEALKTDALRELEAKVGVLPEAELSAAVREVLAALRLQVRGEERSTPGTGSAAVTGQTTPDAGQPAQAGGAPNALALQEALQVARGRFPDVAESLQRYYRDDPKGPR